MTKSIFLVEDDPFLIDIYSKKFQKSGFDIKAADSASKLFQLLEEKIPEVILLDIVLPQMDGWSILKKIRENKAWDTCQIIIFSNLSQKEEVEKGLALGANKYLIKSQHTPLEIVQEVEKILKD
ncbi:MAG: response regulator [bacterium]